MVTCCKNCVPPKRHIGCHSTCEIYISNKEAHNKRKKEENDKANIAKAINQLNRDVIYKQNNRSVMTLANKKKLSK